MSSSEYQDIKAELVELRTMIAQLLNLDRMVSIKEAAGILECSEATIRRRIQDGTYNNYAPPKKAIKLKLTELMAAKGGGKLSALSVM